MLRPLVLTIKRHVFCAERKVNNAIYRLRFGYPRGFDERKATQVAAKILANSEKPMTLGHIMNIMYMIDRESLLRDGAPVLNDIWIKTEEGVKFKYVAALASGRARGTGYWREHMGLVSPDELIGEPFGTTPKVDQNTIAHKRYAH